MVTFIKQQGEKCSEIAQGHFTKSQKLLTENLHIHAHWEGHQMYSEHSISMAGYVTAVLAFVRAELHAREASHFHAFDFSECQFEEVMSFFWRSVYHASNIFIQVSIPCS